MSPHAAPPVATGWSSSLSVAEHTAVRQAGFTPRGLVMGTSVYQIGRSWSPMDYYAMSGGYGGGWGGMSGGGAPWAGAPRPGGMGAIFGGAGAVGPGWGGGSYRGWSRTYSAADLGWGGGWPGAGMGAGGPMSMNYGAAAICWERVEFEEGIEAAASLAVGRLLAETVALGAHGVIGTRLAFRYLEGLVSTVEFTALGTAVVRPGAPPLRTPFTSHLPGQDLLKLLGAGLVPVAVAVGAGSVVAEIGGSMMGGGHTEIAPFGDAIETSRRLAGERLVRAARAGGAAVLGTLAATGTEREERGRVSTAILTGTVVRRFAAGAWSSLPMPVLRLSK